MNWNWLEGTELGHLPAFVTRLERRDLISILQFGMLMFVILPILPDVDAITLSNLRLFNMGTLDSGQVAIAVVLAIISNTLFKLGLVLVVGGRPLFGRCAGTMAAVVVGLVIALLLTNIDRLEGDIG